MTDEAWLLKASRLAHGLVTLKEMYKEYKPAVQVAISGLKLAKRIPNSQYRRKLIIKSTYILIQVLEARADHFAFYCKPTSDAYYTLIANCKWAAYQLNN